MCAVKSILDVNELYMCAVKSILDVNELYARRDTDSIVKVLQEPTNSCDIKIKALRHLGRMRDETAVEGVIEAAKDPALRNDAIRTLGEIGGPKAVAYLKGVVKDKEVGSTAERALEVATRSMREEFDTTLRGQVPTGKEESKMRWRFENRELEVTENDIRTMGSLNDIEGLGRLIHHPNSEIRKEAARILCLTENPEAIKYVLVALNDEDVSVRDIAAALLRNLKDERVSEELLGVASNKKEREGVRISAIDSIREIKYGKAAEPFIKILDDESESPDIKVRVANYFWEMADNRAVQSLIRATYNEDRVVKHSAVAALGRMSSIEAYKHLNKLREEFKDSESLLSSVESAIDEWLKNSKKGTGKVTLDSFTGG